MSTEIVFDDLDTEELQSNPLENVARGVALLDETRPGWVQEINVKILDLRSPILCILGQLYGGDYSRGWLELKIGLMMEPYGFCPYFGDLEQTTAEWKRIIAERVN